MKIVRQPFLITVPVLETCRILDAEGGAALPIFPLLPMGGQPPAMGSPGKPVTVEVLYGKAGRLEDLLVEDPETGVVRVTKDLRAGKLAILDYEVVGTDPGKTMAHVRCTLFTGRKHQIRVQLQAMGHPVVADPMYALPGKTPMPHDLPGRLALHASHLAFEHPGTRRRVAYDSLMPGSFSHLLRGGGG